jgi:polar amino acid transport system substrate-binding protein
MTQGWKMWRTLSTVVGLAVGLALGLASAHADVPVPAPGTSKTIDQIKQRGSLRAAAIGEFPWLPENTTGSGDPFSGPAWILANEYANRLGVKLVIVPVSHETKVPILATGQADITIAPLTVTEARSKVVDFVVYSKSSLCFFGLASNPRLKTIKDVDELNAPDITMAYFSGTPPELWAPKRFPQMKFRAVAGSGANAPVEEIMSKRADLASIDNVAWPQLNKSVPGLVVFPRGDGCLTSSEMEGKTGMAVNKGDQVYLDWLRAVAAEVQPKLDAEELRIMKAAGG